MTDFNKILDKAKELEAKMRESQENIKKIRVEGVSGSNSIKVILDGEGEMQKIEISKDILNDEKTIIEDLIVAAHNNAKAKLKKSTFKATKETDWKEEDEMLFDSMWPIALSRSHSMNDDDLIDQALLTRTQILKEKYGKGDSTQ